jgi:hypothetical protein
MTARMGKAVVREWVAQRVGGGGSGRQSCRVHSAASRETKMMDALINLM